MNITFFKKSKMMPETSGCLQLTVLPHPGCGPDSTYTCVKPCWKEVLTFLLLDYSLKFYIRL